MYYFWGVFTGSELGNQTFHLLPSYSLQGLVSKVLSFVPVRNVCLGGIQKTLICFSFFESYFSNITCWNWNYQWSVGRLPPGRGLINALPTQKRCQRIYETEKETDTQSSKIRQQEILLCHEALLLIEKGLKGPCIYCSSVFWWWCDTRCPLLCL